MKLRNAYKQEVPVLTELSIKAFHTDILVGGEPEDGPPDYDSLIWHEEMQKQGHLYTYLDDQDHVIGGAVLFPSGFHLYIGRIFIDPAHFRKGYGFRLMQGIEAFFPKAYVFDLNTPLCNVRTNALYQKLGYREIQRTEDCVSYRKELVPVVELHDEEYAGITNHYRDAGRVILMDGDQILLTHEEHVDQWMLPGGGIENEETPLECCMREVQEETGLVVQCGNCVVILDEFCGEHNFVNYYFEAFPTGKTCERHLTAREKKAGAKPKWLPLSEALELFSKYAEYHDDGSDPYVMRQGLYRREYHALLQYLKKEV